jgi:antitoxin (DNA-binding transcriptional repressor) of toxin-antitoxin stability system
MYTFSVTRTPTYTLSVSDAAKRGIAGLARDAETGSSITVERNHRPVAAIIGVNELHRYQEAERDLRDLAVVLIRTAADNGERTSLDDVFSRFGFDRATLEREVDEDLAAGRE